MIPVEKMWAHHFPMQIQLMVSYLDSFLIKGGIYMFPQLDAFRKLPFAGIFMEHVENGPGKSFSGTFFFCSENFTVCSVHADVCTSYPYSCTGWKGILGISTLNFKLEGNVGVPFWNIWKLLPGMQFPIQPICESFCIHKLRVVPHALWIWLFSPLYI